jgi:hypothetical protein
MRSLCLYVELDIVPQYRWWYTGHYQDLNEGMVEDKSVCEASEHFVLLLIAIGLLLGPGSVPAAQGPAMELPKQAPQLLLPLVSSNSSWPTAVLAGAYLGETTATSTVISWVSEQAATGKARYGRDRRYDQVVAATHAIHDGKSWYTAHLEGLAPGTTYHYRLYLDGKDVTPNPDLAFVTAPAPGGAGFTFAVLGDSRPTGRSMPPTGEAEALAAAMAAGRYALGLHTGDLVTSGGLCTGPDSAWNQYIRAYFHLYGELLGRTPFYPSIGNHELSGGECGYQAYTGLFALPDNAPRSGQEIYYSFDWGDAHFVALNTTQDYSLASAQYQWLVRDLQANTGHWTFVFFHHPAYSSGAEGSRPAVQSHLVPLFEAQGVDVVFTGHDHHYERTCPIRSGACTTAQDGGVVYFVTGGGGAPLRDVSGAWFTAHKASTHHFLRAWLVGCSLQIEAVGTRGEILDRYEMEKDCALGQ